METFAFAMLYFTQSRYVCICSNKQYEYFILKIKVLAMFLKPQKLATYRMVQMFDGAKF